MNDNRCLICWEKIEEGHFFCPSCEQFIRAREYPEKEEQPQFGADEEMRGEMKMINWKVRFANRNFWLQAIPALLLLIQVVLNVFGVAFDFGDIGNKLLAVVNAVFAFLTILGVVNDPTTDGLGDSNRAMTYQEPYKD